MSAHFLQVVRGQRARGYGFTLVELLAVIVIIGVLAGIVIAVARLGTDNASKTRTVVTMHGICVALDMHKADCDWYPPDTRNNDMPENIWPSMSLWYYLQYRLEQGIGQPSSTPRKPYIKFRANELAASSMTISGRPDKYQSVVDAWGHPLNYKSNDGNSYPFGTTSPGDSSGSRQPRHNRNAYDLCSYGANGTTWKDKNRPFQASELPLTGGAGATPPDYFYKPFDTVSGTHCYGGEDGDDINNWQQR